MNSRHVLFYTLTLSLLFTVSFSFAETIYSTPLGGDTPVLGIVVDNEGNALGGYDVSNRAIRVGQIQYSTSGLPGSWHIGDAENFQQWVNNGFAGGAWDGWGFSSNSAASDPNMITCINWCTGEQYLDWIGKSTFHGVTVQPTDFLASFGYYGDCDMNGIVDENDIGLFELGLDIGFMYDAPSTILGDANYDGFVDGSDAGWIYSALSEGNPYGYLNPAYDVIIPEPSTIVLLFMGALGLLVFRRIKK
jgi:hypothetical protein